METNSVIKIRVLISSEVDFSIKWNDIIIQKSADSTESIFKLAQKVKV